MEFVLEAIRRGDPDAFEAVVEDEDEYDDKYECGLRIFKILTLLVLRSLEEAKEETFEP